MSELVGIIPAYDFTPANRRVMDDADFNKLDEALAQMPQAEFQVEHEFIRDAEGKVVMYIRTFTMPANTYLTSRIHNTQHPFVITKGLIDVYSKNDGVQRLAAGHRGTTQPNTRRMLHAIEETVWVTFHATSLDDPQKIGEQILLPHPVDLTITGPARVEAIEQGAS